jgi:probable phosphomutase (TIGR03848 family)
MPKQRKDKDPKKKTTFEKPTVVLLVRHGQNDWAGKHKLAGWTPGVHLNKLGQAEAIATARRLAKDDIVAVYSSPLERTMETAAEIARVLKLKIQPKTELGEVNYGDWTGRAIDKLTKTDTWPVVQFYPSAARFPNGEALYETQTRAVRQVNALVDDHQGQTIVIVSHADLIKSVVAHYLGVHLDLFQRIVISPASVTAISFFKLGPRIHLVNDTSHLRNLKAKVKKKK